MVIDWNSQLAGQLDWHWTQQLRRTRLDGLTDNQHFWEPVPGCWKVRQREESEAPVAAGSGDYTIDTIDFAFPQQQSAPVTTTAWRLAHIIVGVFSARAVSHFGGPPRGVVVAARAQRAAEPPVGVGVAVRAVEALLPETR